MCINKTHNAYSSFYYASKSVQRGGGWTCIVFFVWASICMLLRAYEYIYFWICLCGFVLIYACVFVHTHASCVVVCSRNCVFVLVVGLEWNMDILPPSWIHRNGLGPGLQSSIYTLYLSVGQPQQSLSPPCDSCVFALLSTDSIPSRRSFSPPPQKKRFPQKCSRHPRSEFHQPPLIVADQACSGFHSTDATLKLTTSIITHPYFSDEFV